VVGEGTQLRSLRRMASGNVEFAGYCAPERVAEIISKARAFVFASREDFGIAPLEAQACGTPVVAYTGGAARETIRGLDSTEPTGVLFGQQTVESLQRGVQEFEQSGTRILPDVCRRNAQGFSPDRFRRELRGYVEAAIEQRQREQPSTQGGRA
jgi:glycosyltransferase involved in cell wall biosynthesis